MPPSIRASLTALFALSTTTCGDDVVVEPDFGEVCGADGPFRVLALPPDQQLRFRPLQIGDRVLYKIGTRGEDKPDATSPVFDATAVWSTGLCGESPVKLASDVALFFTIDLWPDEVLGCTAAGDVVRLDPEGVEPPHVVFADVGQPFGCGLGWTPHGLLSVEDHGDGLGALRLHPYPADPRDEAPPPITLLDPIQAYSEDSGALGTTIIGDVFSSFQEFVLAITPDDDLVRVELASGIRTTLQPGVSGFKASLDGRYILWQDHVVTDDDERNPGGKLFLRDVTTGVDQFLIERSLGFSSWPLRWIDEGIVEIGLGYLDQADKRVFSLPSLEYVDVPLVQFLIARLSADRWLSWLAFYGYYDLVDPRTATATRLFPRPGKMLYRSADAIDLLDAPNCCNTPSNRDVAPIWRVAFDGSAPQKLVDRATSFMRRLPDGRYLGPVAPDERWRSPLVVVDPDTRAEQPIDRDVFAYSIDVSRFDDDGLVTYSVSDGDRSGVYLVRLPETSTPRAAALPAAQPVVPLGPDGRPAQDEPPTHITTGARRR